MDIRKVARHALYRALIEDFGAHKSYASDLAAGRARPGTPQALKIEAATGLPAASWLRDPCLAFWELLLDREIAKRNVEAEASPHA